MVAWWIISDFFVIFLVFSFFVVGCIKKVPPGRGQTSVDDTNVQVVEQPAPAAITPQQYQASLKLALQPFWQDQAVAETKAAVLDLTAPTDFLSLHFKVVVALETIEQGQKSADQAQIEEGFEELNALAQQYSWLK